MEGSRLEVDKKILENKAKCGQCGDVLVSGHVHDFVTCSCGAFSVDGGRCYLKRCWSPGGTDYEELSTYEEDDNE